MRFNPSRDTIADFYIGPKRKYINYIQLVERSLLRLHLIDNFPFYSFILNVACCINLYWVTAKAIAMTVSKPAGEDPPCLTGSHAEEILLEPVVSTRTLVQYQHLRSQIIG